jgi:uncharacterized membrane protein YqhA
MIEKIFERILWNTRFIVVVAVVACLFTSVAMFFIATIDVTRLPHTVIEYMSPVLSTEERHHLYNRTVADVAGIIDAYLFATIMLIFALGLYELFVSKIEAAENSEFAERILLVRSLDDLKDRLAKVIFLILIVKYFEYALDQTVHTSLDLLMLAVGIALIALAIFLTRAAKGDH